MPQDSQKSKNSSKSPDAAKNSQNSKNSQNQIVSKQKVAENIANLILKDWKITHDFKTHQNTHKNTQQNNHQNTTQNHKPLKAVFFDVDGTLSRDSLLIMFIHMLSLKNILPTNQAKKIQQAKKAFVQREWEYDEYAQLIIDTVNTIHGLDYDTFTHILNMMFDEFGTKYYVITYILLKKLQDLGYKLIAVSGAPDFTLPEFFKRINLKVDHIFATKFIFENNVFVADDVTVVRGKGQFIKEQAQKLKIDLNQSIALGDTSSDISMFEAIKYPLAINPNYELATYCKQNNVPFVIERKNLVLYVKPSKENNVVIY